MMVEISIAVITMDRPEILSDTLAHLERKGLTEYVLVVDGSTNDESEEICKKYNIDYYRQKSNGMTSARNEALEYCETDYIAFIDDDVRVSEDWFERLSEAFRNEDVVGVTGRLENEETSITGFASKIRKLLFGGKSGFGEVLDNGVINGDFFYGMKKEVDHMPGCNMSYKKSALESLGGFDEDIDVGNSYREDTIASYKVSKQGKILYIPEASVDHLAVDEEGDEKKWMFYNPYLTKYFLHDQQIITGFQNRLSYFFNLKARHSYFLITNLKHPQKYLYYLYGEISSFIDFIIFNRKPREYV